MTIHTVNDPIKDIHTFTRRIQLVSIWIAIFFLILLTRLIYLQVHQHHKLATLSHKNQITFIPIAASRGLIYDRHGVLIAENIPVHNLEITPDRTKNIESTIEKLEQITAISEEDKRLFYKQLRQRRPFDPIPLRFKLSKEEVAKLAVEQYHLPGVNVTTQLMRHYPLGAQLAHVLGYVGRINESELQRVDKANYSATNFIGKTGIEKYYEQLLHGKVGYSQIEKDASGRTVRLLKSNPPLPGHTLHLTIDSQLQATASKLLGKQRGAIVAIEPHTGEILALASSPTYDPNRLIQGIDSKSFTKLSKNQSFYNRATLGLYSLASTIKPFLALQGLDSGVINVNDKIYDPGWFKLPNSSHIYRDLKRTGHGWTNLHRAIVVSCDTYFYNLAKLMGIKSIHNILQQFGFGQHTNIDLYEESPGLLPNPAWKLKNKGQSWYPGDTILIGIGQGYILSTPLQLATATAIFATKGKYYQPHLLKKQTTDKEEPLVHEGKLVQTLKLQHPLYWQTVINAMQDVTTSHEGTGKRYGPHPYTIAAKTGTAQLFDSKVDYGFSKNDTPEHLRDHSLFIGFAPAEQAKIAVAVVVENSRMAIKIARQLVDTYLLQPTSTVATS